MQLTIFSIFIVLAATTAIFSDFGAAAANLPPPSNGLVLLGEADENHRGASTRVSRYYVSTFSTNSYEAELYCSDQGYGLLSIQTQTEQTTIERLLASSNPYPLYWTSGSDLSNEGFFLWVSIARAITYTNYDSRNSNSKDRNCIAIGGAIGSSSPLVDRFKWTTTYCSNANYFICEAYA